MSYARNVQDSLCKCVYVVTTNCITVNAVYYGKCTHKGVILSIQQVCDFKSLDVYVLDVFS